jgi:hypothetical protein
MLHAYLETHFIGGDPPQQGRQSQLEFLGYFKPNIVQKADVPKIHQVAQVELQGTSPSKIQSVFGL